MVNVAHLIPLFPFLAFAINIAFGRRLKDFSAIVAVVMSVISLVLSIRVAQGFLAGGGSYILGTWLTLNNQPFTFGVTVDALSVMMLLVVMIVGTLIQVYSIGYMHGDPRYSRYFAYLSLFMASMLGLILADNFLMVYIFWEGVGVCSYLLISFWFEKPAAAKAGLKAFIVTRIGDTGFLIGIFFLFMATHSLYFRDLEHLTSIPGSEWMLTAAALLIFCGAVGKSAQFPLHVWLPDAMEGPTAVSALIHAATMVAAGVYLVARTYGLFVLDTFCLDVVAVIGGISALLAASIATVNNDIKRVLAYSTVSQLGLMMLGLGVGGFTAGTFHLMTHAFFKALLFLCAGSVIHAVHTQDIQKMGGLLSKMKVTGICFIIGTLALAGVPPFAGFWSKDEILLAAFHGHPILFGMAVLASFLTSFYMSRLIFLVLFGKPRSDMHPHEAPATMTIPLIILSFFAAGVGLVGSPFMDHLFQHYIFFGDHGAQSHGESGGFIMMLSTVISFAGIGLAYVFYMVGNKGLPASLAKQFAPVHRLLVNKYYIDEIYDAVFVKPCMKLCGVLADFDNVVVDGIVNGTARVVQWFSGILRPLQTGLVQNYLLVQVIGVVLFILVIVGNICAHTF